MKQTAWWIARELLEAVGTLVALAILCFFLIRALPGGPFDDDVQLHPLVEARLREAWALDRSLPSQLGHYLGSVARGDLGVSMSDPGRTVASIIGEGFRQTLALNVFALAVVFVLGFTLALLSQWDAAGKAEGVVDSVTLALISLPSLFLGPLLIWIFALKFDWLPVAFLDSPTHFILPVATLCLRPSAYLARLLMSSLRELRHAEFLVTAKAKGLSRRQVLFRHALKPSLIPVISASAPLVVGLLSGSFMVEVLFAVRGLGASFVEALSNRDYPVVMGLTLTFGAMLVVTSTISDLLLRRADPRIDSSELAA